MALYWIGYDLDKPGQDYTDLIRRIQQLGGRRVLKSDWLLPTKTQTAEKVRDELLKYIDSNDRIIVAELKNHAAWNNLLLSAAEVKKLFTDYAS